MPEPLLYIGLMSGTSIDAVDAVLVDFSTPMPKILAHHETEIPTALRNDILDLTRPGDDGVDKLGRCDVAVGNIFAEAAKTLLAANRVDICEVAAIGSHGQTIRHRPPQHNEENPFTLQIGDPNVIAARTSITTVADFRRRDIALGGQGAPLAPAFHNAVFRSSVVNRAILNLGGIANVTWLPTNDTATGFDTGPANVLMDGWCQRHREQPYDNNGNWAASGSVHLKLLNKLLNHPFLSLPCPKSTGREDFNMAWLDQILTGFSNELPASDVQATLLEFTARSTAEAIQSLSAHNSQPVAELYLCGGGALNAQLVTRLEDLLDPIKVDSTSILGMDPKLVEGAAFAWLAKCTLERMPGNLPAVTGASHDAILGGVYFS